MTATATTSATTLRLFVEALTSLGADSGSRYAVAPTLERR